MHKIGRKSLPINGSTRVCSDHFVNAAGRLLQPDEYPMVNLLVLHISTSQAKPRKPPVVRAVQPVNTSPNTSDEEESSEEIPVMADAEIQVSDDYKNVITELPSSFMHQNCALQISVKVIARSCFILIFQTVLL